MRIRLTCFSLLVICFGSISTGPVRSAKQEHASVHHSRKYGLKAKQQHFKPTSSSRGKDILATATATMWAPKHKLPVQPTKASILKSKKRSPLYKVKHLIARDEIQAPEDTTFEDFPRSNLPLDNPAPSNEGRDDLTDMNSNEENSPTDSSAPSDGEKSPDDAAGDEPDDDSAPTDSPSAGSSLDFSQDNSNDDLGNSTLSSSDKDKPEDEGMGTSDNVNSEDAPEDVSDGNGDDGLEAGDSAPSNAGSPTDSANEDSSPTENGSEVVPEAEDSDEGDNDPSPTGEPLRRTKIERVRVKSSLNKFIGKDSKDLK